MDTVVTQNATAQGVTVTYAMMLMGVGIGLVVELVKTVLSRFAWFTADMKKPLLPLLGVLLAMLIFRVMGSADWLAAGMLIGLGAGGGYDWTVGMMEKLGLKAKAVVPVLLIGPLLLAPGCNQFASNPNAELLASQKAFTATVDSLTALQKAGKFNPQETQQLTVLIHQGQDYLIKWRAALKAGQSKPDVIAAFQTVLQKLIEVNTQKGGSQ